MGIKQTYALLSANATKGKARNRPWPTFFPSAVPVSITFVIYRTTSSRRFRSFSCLELPSTTAPRILIPLPFFSWFENAMRLGCAITGSAKYECILCSFSVRRYLADLHFPRSQHRRALASAGASFWGVVLPVLEDAEVESALIGIWGLESHHPNFCLRPTRSGTLQETNVNNQRHSYFIHDNDECYYSNRDG